MITWIQTSSQFVNNTPTPLDAKRFLTTTERLSLIPFVQAYDDMIVRDKDKKAEYRLIDMDNIDNDFWRLLCGWIKYEMTRHGSEFLSNLVTSLWYQTNNTWTGANVNIVTWGTNWVCRVNTGTTSTWTWCMMRWWGRFRLNNVDLYHKTRVRLSTLPDWTQNYVIYIWSFDNASNTPGQSNWVYFVENTWSVNRRVVCVSDWVSTVVDTWVLLTELVWVDLEYRVIVWEARFWIDWNYVWQINTNLPSNTSNLWFWRKIIKTAGTTDRFFDVENDFSIINVL